MKKNKKLNPNSLCAAETYIPPAQSAHAMPLYATSAFNAGSLEDSIAIFNGSVPGYVYSRYDNPNARALADKIAALEGNSDENSFGFLTSSGMAAIDTAINVLVESGSFLITHDGLYGASTELILLKKAQMNLELIITDFNNLSELESRLSTKKNNGFIYLETPSNPLLKCIDIAGVANVCKKYGIRLVVDNTFATPLVQRPLEKGADIVLHSTTKYIAGHGMSSAGALVCSDSELSKKIEKQIRLSGCFCSPFEAWLTYHGMKTMGLRLERQQSNAEAIFRFLKKTPQVDKVYFTGDPDHPQADLIRSQMNGNVPMISFSLFGDLKKVSTFFDKISVIRHATTLGDLNTLVLHPDSSSHRNIELETKRKEGITETLIRMSVGIENIDDLVSDLAQALE
jgi:methionine-gamma-lyase